MSELNQEIPKATNFDDAWTRKLHQAGIQYDGHVTNGSLVGLREAVREILREIKSEILVAGDFGKFDGADHEKYPEHVAIDIMKETAKKHGIDI